jgi:serine protease Do
MRIRNSITWLPLALVAAGALVVGQLSPAPPAQASAPVDRDVRTALGAPASFANVIEAVQPAVVNISVSGAISTPEGAPGVPFEDFEDFLRRFFDRQSLPGDPPRTRPEPRETPMFQGMGSGFIVDAKGYVVTNQHVVDHASDITVTLHDGKRLPATLVGVDEKTDLALLKVASDESLPYASFGDSDQTRIGDWVVAIGNPFGFGGSATAGIVSARGRDIQSGPFDDFLQIDAPINRGNSGGPLFDLEGKVIGINTAIYSPNGGSVGIGFAIPANLAARVVEELRTNGRVERGFIGVSIQQVDEEIAQSLGVEKDKGALVASVVPGSPADRAGLEAGDVILSVNGTEVVHVKDISRRIAETKPDEKVAIAILRAGDKKTLQVRVGRMEETGREAAMAGEPGENTAASLGLELADLTPQARARLGLESDLRGALVVGVDPAGAASRKGLREGDVIVMVGQTPVEGARQAIAEIDREKSAGRQSVLLRVVREGDSAFVAVPVA